MGLRPPIAVLWRSSRGYSAQTTLTHKLSATVSPPFAPSWRTPPASARPPALPDGIERQEAAVAWRAYAVERQRYGVETQTYGVETRTYAFETSTYRFETSTYRFETSTYAFER